MTSYNKHYQLWLIALIVWTVSNSLATKRNPSIRVLLDKLYLNEQLNGHSSGDESKKDEIQQHHNDSTTIFPSSEESQKNLIGNTSQNGTALRRINEFLNCWSNPHCLKMIFSEHSNKNKSGITLQKGTNMDNRIPFLLMNDIFKPLNNYLITGDPLLKLLKNISSIEYNGSGSKVDYFSNNDYSESIHDSQRSNNLRGKNFTLLEAIVDTFFPNILKNTEIISEKKNYDVRKLNSKEIEVPRFNNTILDNLVKKNTSIMSNSLSNLNEADLVMNKCGLLSTKLNSIKLGSRDPVSFRPKAEKERNKLPAYTSKNEYVRKPIKLSELAKNDEMLRSLFNETLINFSSQIFDILQDSEYSSSQEHSIPNEIKIDKQRSECLITNFSSINRNQKSIPYEIIPYFNATNRPEIEKRILMSHIKKKILNEHALNKLMNALEEKMVVGIS